MTTSLTPEERERVAELFDEVASLAEDEREAFIEHGCQASVPVREELRRLLPAVGVEGVVARAMPRASVAPGTRIGPYVLLEKIGEGGMGEVYAADQLEPVSRRVALKLVRAGMESTEVLVRFEAERQALARMGHPAVAQVFDGGTAEDGRPYFVMEFVAGEPITEHCDRLGLTTRERVRLFLGVCDGIQHAHQKGLIHRDLKPSNILVADDHGSAAPKIIDFGIARATFGRLSEESLHTLTGQVIGTLDYMSPEQADGSRDVDTRSDIYSAGVVLYQLVSGLLPFGRLGGARTPFHELQREILEVDPQTPSARLRSGVDADTRADMAQRHGADPRGLVRELRGDLDWICIKALEKDPARRYASASELADDLRRYLAHEPVLAGRPGPLYRARRFVRRHRVGVGAAVVITAGTLAAVIGIVSGQAEVAASHRLALAARDAERIPEIERAAGDLWPPHPDQINAMVAWRKEAMEVIEREPRHLERLRWLEEKAPSRDPETARARAWEASSLTRAVEGMARLRSGLLAEDATLEGQGPSVPKRLRFARAMAAGDTAGSEMALAWERAAREMPGATTDLDGDGVPEHPYESLHIVPQVGLLPIGPDAESGLWVFAHLLTGAPPSLDEKGSIVLTAETCVVLVLMPERTFWMGSDEEKVKVFIGPRHEVALSTHFLSKYEMTQGQWERLTGSNPSGYGPAGQWNPEWLDSEWFESRKDVPLLHPVEQVSWEEASSWLQRAGLSLPTEAQWEHGARAGTLTPYWAGETLQDLEGIANVRDEFCQQGDVEFWLQWHRDFNDHSAVHWPVGWARKPNRFGLHDVHGNVREWCRDGYNGRGGYDRADYAETWSRDPEALPSLDERRIYRGSSWRHPLPSGASAARGYYPPSFAGSGIGVRPARSWVP